MPKGSETHCVGDPQGLQSPESTDPAADNERVQGPMTRTRTSSERQGEVPRLEGPYPPGCEVPRAGTPRATDSGTEGPLRKVKKVNKPKKKDTKRIGDKKKKVLADVLLTEGLLLLKRVVCVVSCVHDHHNTRERWC